MNRWKTMRIAPMLLVSLACASIPDVQPFATQTTRMSTAIGSGYAHTETLLLETAYGRENQNRQKLQDDWKESRRALNAIVEYSDALAALADAGAKGSEAAGSVADAVNGIASVLGLGSIPARFVTAFQAINEEIAKIRARNDMKDAVDAAQPAIALFANIIAEKLTALAELNDTAGEEILTQHAAAHQNLTNYYESLVRVDEYVIEHLTLILDYRLTGDIENLNPPRGDRSELDPRFVQTAQIANEEERLAAVTRLETEFLRRSKALRAEIARYEGPYRAIQAQDNRIVTLRNNGTGIMNRGQAAVRAWATAHSKLRVTLNKKQRLNIAQFAAVVGEVAGALGTKSDQ